MTIPIPLPLQRPTRANPAAENKSPGRHVGRATGAGVQRDLARMSAKGRVRPCSGPASKRSWQGAPKTREHAMSPKLNAGIAVIGIDIGKNSFHVVGLDRRGAIVLRQKWSR